MEGADEKFIKAVLGRTNKVIIINTDMITQVLPSKDKEGCISVYFAATNEGEQDCVTVKGDIETFFDTLTNGK